MTKRFLGASLFLLLVPLIAHGQQNRLINTHDWHYTYIKQLQQRGYMLSLNPTRLPYNIDELRKALDRLPAEKLNELERQWYDKLQFATRERTLNLDSMRVGGTFKGGARRSSSARFTLLQPAGDPKPVVPMGRPNVYMEWKNWIGQAGITFDWQYDLAPIGLDVGRRLYIRSEEAYFGYNGSRLEFYIGRFDNHWSLHNRRGAFLTDNPRSFDQLQIRFGSDKLSFTSILGTLDNMGKGCHNMGVDPDIECRITGHHFDLGDVRRYAFLHRLDWSPQPNLKLTFIEGEIYDSPTASISLRNIMPLHFMFFESHTAPQNNNSNLFIGGSAWYQRGPLTFFFQGMVDDFVVEDREELRKSDNLIPVVYTINSSINWAGFLPRTNLGFEADLVSFNSYRTRTHAEQWTYAQRGIATNFSDYVRLNMHASIFPGFMEGLTVEPAFTAYYKGVGDFRDLRTSESPSGEQVSSILVGTVERTFRPALNLRYQPKGIQIFDPKRKMRFNWWFDANMGINLIKNYNHQKGVAKEKFIGLFRLFGQVTF